MGSTVRRIFRADRYSSLQAPLLVLKSSCSILLCMWLIEFFHVMGGVDPIILFSKFCSYLYL